MKLGERRCRKWRRTKVEEFHGHTTGSRHGSEFLERPFMLCIGCPSNGDAAKSAALKARAVLTFVLTQAGTRLFLVSRLREFHRRGHEDPPRPRTQPCIFPHGISAIPLRSLRIPGLLNTKRRHARLFNLSPFYTPFFPLKLKGLRLSAALFFTMSPYLRSAKGLFRGNGTD